MPNSPAPNTPTLTSNLIKPLLFGLTGALVMGVICWVLQLSFGDWLVYSGWGLAVGFLIAHLNVLMSLQKFANWIGNNPNWHTTQRPPKLDSSFNSVAEQIYHAKHEQKIVHQANKDMIAKIHFALSALTDAVILIDEKDRLSWCNPAAQTLLNVKPSDHDSPILSVIRTPLFHEYFNNIANFPEGIRLNSWQNPERFVQCEITEFGQEKLIIIYDVTRLQHLEQMRKDFVANVSHELRTPLTVIMGYVETLSEQPDLHPRWQRAYTQMMQQSQRMNNIINDLLLLSRLENEEKLGDMTDIDIPKLLMELFDDSQIYNKSYGHLIHLHIDSQQHIYGYEKYLTSALSNLITNAIKYTPTDAKKQGEISINWYEKDGGVCFSVSDNGIGIEARHIERLTERFYRVDSGRSRETGGTGLGLAIVKHVLYQHDATLHITSKMGQGSTFEVFFPKQKVVL